MRTRTPWGAAALAVTALALANPSAHAATVWNVNIGSEITTSDNFVGAAPENTVPNSFWNSAVPTDPFTSFAMALADSTGTASTATLTLTGTVAIGYAGGWAGITGPDIFDSWIKTTGNTTPFNMTIGGLSSSTTYDLIVYSDWFWKDDATFPVTQTVGSGLTGTATLDQIHTGTNGAVPALVQDTDLSLNGATEGNWIRINGLTANSGTLAFSMGGKNSAFSGFQLVGVSAVPEPSSAALLGGLFGLALLRRRR